jgi:hypothetical protein
MRWQVLAALTNGWLWLLAVLSTVVLVVGTAPVWFALMTGAAVLVGGATVQAAVEWRQEKRRRLGDRTPAAALEDVGEVSDPDAQAVIARAHAAARRVRAARADDPAPTDVLVEAAAATDGAVTALHELGHQVDRLDRALRAVDARRVQSELARVEERLAADASASPALTEQRQTIAASLRAQLAAHDRLRDKRVLVLTRMQSAAVGLEALAVRLSEVSALYSARHDDAVTSTDLASVAGEIDALRTDLVDAEASLRQSLRSLD